ncbi:hypothetical protein D3C76_1022440 [compost metagenome]
MYSLFPVGLYIIEAQSPAAKIPSLLVLIYSSTIIAPFGSISNLSLNRAVLGLNPIHRITRSASYSPLLVITLVTLPSFPSNLLTVSPKASLIPWFLNSSSAVSVNSLSRYLLKTLSIPSIKVTSLPFISKASTSSTPI